MKDSAMLGTSGYKRRDKDAYWTPAWVTEAVLSKVTLRGAVWEPACGRGDMTKVLQDHGYLVWSTDLVDHGFECELRDFLEAKATAGKSGGIRSIVTNPPYSHAQAFIRKALEITRDRRGMVVMLLRNEFDSAASRRDLFESPEFARKLVLTKRPQWADKIGAPRHNFAWFVWDHAYAGEPTLEYLP